MDEAPYTTDDDPLDQESLEAPGLGVLVRTDFSNEVAWQDFLSKLKEGEAEFLDAPMDVEAEEAEADERSRGCG